MKRCSKCRIEKPLVEFSKNKTAKDGLRCQCRECCTQYRIANKDKRKQYIIRNADKIGQQTRQCNNNWRIDNPDYHKQYDKQRRIDKPEYFKQYGKQYYNDNVDKCRQYSKEYNQTPQGKLVKKSHKHKRRALLMANTPVGKHWTPNDIILKFKLQHGKCIYCEKSIKVYYEIDHIIPLCKGGSNMASNIQLLCEKCNGAGGKGRKLPYEFAQQHGKLI